MPLSSFILHPSSLRRGFTLTELMISVALALLLLLGINQVFKTTAQTVGTSYATLEGARKQLALDNVLNSDFAKAVSPSEQPAIVIHSESLAQYWDKAEADNDKDSSVFTVDLDDDNLYTSAGEDAGYTGNGTGAADLRNGRNHRLDRVSFFARDVDHPFHRQTGDTKLATDTGDRIISDETSAEAWISYGFLRLPRDKPTGAGGLYDPRLYNGTVGDYFEPGQTPAQQNANNFYAKDWALGRQAILLRSLPDADYLSLNNPASTIRIPPLSPNALAYSTSLLGNAVNPATGAAWLAAHSRYDVAASTIRSLRSSITSLAAKRNPIISTSTLISEIDTATGISLGLDYLFNAKPWLDPAAARVDELATTNPFLTRGCSQFIVEFAGDFMTQDNDPTSATYGNYKLNSGPDGILDFAVANGVRRTRWYGFPRDIAGNVSAINPSGGPDGAITINHDVVPVRDLMGTRQPFEHFRSYISGVLKDELNGGEWGAPGDNYLAPARRIPQGAQYVCAWGPDELKTSFTSNSTIPTVPGNTVSNSSAYQIPGPWLIRVILNVRDPNGRLPDGQTVEHVYDLTKSSK